MNVNITFCEESEICTVRNEYNNDTSIVHVLYDPLDINYFVIKLVILGQYPLRARSPFEYVLR